MFRSLLLITLLICAVALNAEPDYYPQTLIAENFNATWCPGFADANAGIDVLESQFHPGEFFSFRYYLQSGDLSNAWSDTRGDFYNVSLLPTVVFNGTVSETGTGDDIANGSTFLGILEPKLYTASPVKIHITDFNATTATVSGVVTMMSTTFSLNNQSLNFVLVESNVQTDGVDVVREVITESVNLSGQNTTQDFSQVFTTVTSGNPTNFWVAVFIQLDDHTIIQSASSLVQPQYQIRAAFPFSTHIIDQPNYTYNSEPIWLFNTGVSDNFTIRLMADDAPTDWYFNYCDEEGSCYPGNLQTPFSLASGEYIGFHLNLSIGSSGIASFHFEIDSDNIEPYNIPFIYQTSDAVSDGFTTVSVVGLMQNYPNPFSNNTTLRIYSKQATGPVEIEIYNTKGQKVNSIVTDNLQAGSTLLNWNGTDSRGKKLSQGIYYSRLKGRDNSIALKMLIINK